MLLRTWLPYDWTPRSEAYFVFPLAQGTPGKQCGLAATGVYQPSLRSPWLAARVLTGDVAREVHNCIQVYSSRLGCRVIELNVQPDHVHLLV
ncbi:transposase, partial [Thiolapillus sp.]|uniref:transposase n=1 Tax=Thiolapillus sp. TaxID=2017437 RepID=UPI0035A87CBC